jgi:hypothetical protein
VFSDANLLGCGFLFDNLWRGLINVLKIYSKFIANLIEMEATQKEYQEIVSQCRSLFEKKMKDYGAAWRILRLPSLTDQIFIKAQRIRSLQTQTTRKVDEGEVSEFIGIVNYSVMALIQIKLGVSEQVNMNLEEALEEYDAQIQIIFELMLNKNHDYGEAWRDMRVSSLTDLILQKLLRVKQIEENQGKTLVSEGVDANYHDMVNYAIFALIHLKD